MTTRVTIRRENKKTPRINSKGETTVYILYQHNQKSAYFPVFKSRPEELNLIERNDRIELMEPYIRKGSLRKSRISEINTLRNTIISIAEGLNSKNIDPTINLVKGEFDNTRASNTQALDPNPISAEDVFKQFIITADSTRWSSGTIRQYNSTLNALIRFKDHSGHLPKINEFDLSFYDQFVEFLIDIENKKTNTVGNLIKNLKAFLNWAKSRGYDIHPDIHHPDFKKPREKTSIHYLTQDELEHLINLDLNTNQRLEKVRDVFVFNCRTGMRYGDLSRFNKSHIKKHRTTDGKTIPVIELLQKKNSTENFVPITGLPLKILEKYNYVLPVISQVKMTKYLKELCKIAGIDSLVEKGPIYIPKYEVIGTHTAIKTFITHCVEKRIPPKTVSEITGKSMRVLMDHYYGTNKQIIISDMYGAFG